MPELGDVVGCRASRGQAPAAWGSGGVLPETWHPACHPLGASTAGGWESPVSSQPCPWSPSSPCWGAHPVWGHVPGLVRPAESVAILPAL